MDWLPIVDISRHQGSVDFNTMRRQGVRGLIFRIANGDRIDDRADIYWQGAIAAGFAPADLLWYVFVNPKRCDAVDMARTSVGFIREITRRNDTALMWDCESFDREYGTQGPGLISGADYAAYMRTAIAETRRIAPRWRQFAYSNAAFWDRWVGAHGDDIVHSLEWLVPRYPVYSHPGYARYPLPGVDGWADWAFARATGPRSPRGVDWAGWQFSAGYNRQGPVYGCQSSDLDLNIVRPEAWARWTNTVVPTPEPPPEEPDVYVFIQPQADDFKGGIFTLDGHPVSQATLDELAESGVKVVIVEQSHEQWDEATRHRNGEIVRRSYEGL